MLFLAHILNRPVVDAAGARLGWVEDLILTGLDLFPRVDAIVLARRGRGAVFVPWSTVAQVDRSRIRLAVPREELASQPLDEDAIFLRRDILDKQIVDIHGRKVVRVNDLQLAPIAAELRLVGADIGAGGLLRRLNLERPVRFISRAMNAPFPEHIVPWNYVEGLETEWASVRLNITHHRLRELPPADLADILAQLQPLERDEVLRDMDDETLADTLPHLEEDVQAELIMAMTDERASDIMEMMPPDEAADVLGDLAEERAERILHLMEPDDAADVRELLRYDDDTAGGRMTTEFVALTDHISAADALAQLRREAPDAETIYYVYVTDDAGRLEGVISLRDLITADPQTPIPELTRTDIIRAHVDDDQETVAHTLNHYHLLAVPVVDGDGVLRGIVTVDDVLDVLHEEAQEDISRVSGAIEESDVLATPLESAFLRIPWVLGTAIAGMLVALFLAPRLDDLPSRLAPLLALLPLLLLLGVQLGGQGAAAAQVALGEGDWTGAEILAHLARTVWPVGAALALLAAGLSALFTLYVSVHPHALAVAGVVWAVLLLQMVVGSMLPLLMHRLRWDPVFVSRPALAALAILIGIPLLAQVL